MAGATYLISIEAEDTLLAQRATRTLADILLELPDVVQVSRLKDNANTMDLGTIVQVIATSGGVLALAQGVADWLRRTRGTRLTIVKEGEAGSIKAEVENITAEMALRITEKILGT
jgi:hypothetical protein